MPKDKKSSEKPSGGGTVQSVALSTGKADSQFGSSGHLAYRGKAAKSMIRKGR